MSFSRLLVSVVAALATLLAALPAVAISYGGLGGRPAFPRPDNPRTNDIFVYTVEPGQTVADGMFVINTTDQTKTVWVYSADATPSSDGGFACEQLSASNQGASATKKDAGAWITLGQPQPALEAGATLPPEVTADSFFTPPTTTPTDDSDEDGDGLTATDEAQRGTNPKLVDTDGDGFTDQQEIVSGYDPLQPVALTLAPQTKILVPFRLAVPGTAGVGEHDGCLLIQEKKPPVAGGEGVLISTRTGLRVAVTVPGDIVRQLAIAGFEVRPRTPGGKVLRPSVRNEGNVSVDAEVAVVTKNLFGRTAMRHGGQYTILRGQTSAWNFEFPQTFWGGWYTTALTVAYNPDTGSGPGANASLTTLTGPTVRFFLWPTRSALIIMAAALLLLLLLVGLTMLARKRRQLISATWVRYRVETGDTIQELAKRWGVSWKLLARVNRLAAPYQLTAGVSLLSPPGSRPQPPRITA
ncbi:MAG: LysM peptidoglycan-binding domain-containing protein [Candidatus Kerfeldbacteria bacterium]|nr:LysM peptidoglycan-binding domain-containing protein [Candidatus Kerfeldbacteria bacterium]